MFLDSGYIQSYKDQVNYIKNLSTLYPDYKKFAIYHDPIFPVCLDTTFSNIVSGNIL